MNDLVTPVHRYLHSPATRDLTKFFCVVRFAVGPDPHPLVGSLTHHRRRRSALLLKRRAPISKGIEATRFSAAMIYGIRGMSTRVLVVSTRSRRSTKADRRGGTVME